MILLPGSVGGRGLFVKAVFAQVYSRTLLAVGAKDAFLLRKLISILLHFNFSNKLASLAQMKCCWCFRVESTP